MKKLSELPPLLLLIGGAILLYLLYKLIMFIGLLFIYLGFNLFNYLDKLLEIRAANPVVLWAVFGFLIGSIPAVIVAVKKYRLSKKLIIFPVSVTLLVFIILALVNKPAHAESTFQQSLYEPVTVEEVPAVVYCVTIKATEIRQNASQRSKRIATLPYNTEVIFLKNTREKGKKIWMNIRFTDPVTREEKTGYIDPGSVRYR